MTVLFMLAAASLSAQGLFTTGDLKRACETSPSNKVNITSEVKIESGAVWPAVEQVSPPAAPSPSPRTPDCN